MTLRTKLIMNLKIEAIHLDFDGNWSEILTHMLSMFRPLKKCGKDIGEVQQASLLNQIICRAQDTKGKSIANQSTPPYESASEEDKLPQHQEQDVDYITHGTKNDNQTGSLGYSEGNKCGLGLGGNCRNAEKAKRVRDFHVSQGKDVAVVNKLRKVFILQAVQSELASGTRMRILMNKELEAHYSYLAKILKEVLMQTQALTLSLSRCNKKIQKQLKKANATLTQELTECKSILAETSRTLGESNSIRDSCLVALQNKQTEFDDYERYKNVKYKLKMTKFAKKRRPMYFEKNREQYVEIQDLKVNCKEKYMALRVALQKLMLAGPQPRSNPNEDKVVQYTSHARLYERLK
ncbi:hypothetical protein Tco_1192736 [Tanacetum coccineum]